MVRLHLHQLHSTIEQGECSGILFSEDFGKMPSYWHFANLFWQVLSAFGTLARELEWLVLGLSPRVFTGHSDITWDRWPLDH